MLFNIRQGTIQFFSSFIVIFEANSADPPRKRIYPSVFRVPPFSTFHLVSSLSANVIVVLWNKFGGEADHNVSLAFCSPES